MLKLQSQYGNTSDLCNHLVSYLTTSVSNSLDYYSLFIFFFYLFYFFLFLFIFFVLFCFVFFFFLERKNLFLKSFNL